MTMILRKKFPLATFDIDSVNRIVSAEFTANVKVDLDIAKELVKNRMEITNDEAFYLIIEFSNVREVTSDAKEYLLRPDGGLHNILGAAFMANNPVSALIANVFIKSSKEFPARYFSSKANAVQWIAELQQARLRRL
jgi:hypothetical protein